MASSGTLNTSVANYTDHTGYPDYATFEWSAVKDEANNQSIVTYSLKAKLSSGSSTTAYVYLHTRKLTITANGETLVNKSESSSKKVVKDSVIFSGTVNVPHNSDGTGSFAVNIKLAFYSSSVNSTGSTTFILDTLDSADSLLGVPQAYTINNTTQNTFSPYVEPDRVRQYNLSYTLNGVTTQIWNMQTVSSRTFFTINNADMLSAMNNVAQAVMTLTLETYSGGVLIGSTTATSNITINLNNFVPYFPLPPTASVNTSPINGVLVAGYSTASISGTAVLATGNNSAVLKVKSISFGTIPNDSLPITQGGAISLTTNTFPISASDVSGATVVVYMYDSRGAVSPDYTITLPTIYGYTKPTITGNFSRVADNSTTPPVPDEAGEYVYCSFSASISSVNGNNSLTLSCTYTGESSGTATNGSWVALSEDGTLTFTVTATDLVESTSSTFTVMMAMFPLDLAQEYTQNGTTIGATVGGIAELGKFKSNLPSFFPQKAYGAGIIEYIRGTQSASTASWEGDTEQPALYDGMTIMYYLPFASVSSTNVTLELTFPDGSTSGAKEVYYNSTSRMTTHFGAYSQILLTYHENYHIGSNTKTGWWHDTDRNDNTTYGYCSSAADTVAKTVTFTGYVLRANNLFGIVFTKTNTATSFTLNVNSTGAKAVYINGEPNSSGNTTLPAGTYLCYYDGTRYYLRTDGRLPIPSEAESGIITRSSGATLDYSHGYRNNNVITVYGKLSYSTSVASGADIFSGTISAKYYPPFDVETFAYYQGHAIGIRIEPSGAVTVRNASSSAVTITNGIQFSATYVVFDSTLNANAIVPNVSQNSTTGVVTIS